VIADKQYRADIVIIASGTIPRYGKALLDVPHKRVVFEIYPIRNVKKKKIVIIGAGDAAYDYALNLCRHNEVLILNRSIKKRGLKLLIKRAKQADNITYIQNVRIQEITQTGGQLIAIVSHNVKRYSISADYIIYAIGRQPAIDFLSSSVKQEFPRGGKNLFFIGDVKQGELRQTAIAIGDGIKAAMKIARDA
jgi:thioredoxin reductase